MPKVIKPSNPFTFAGFLFQQHFLRRHKFWLHRQFFSTTEQEMMVIFRKYFRCRFVLNSKRLLSSLSPVIAGLEAVASSIFLHGVIPDAFGSSQNRMCRKLNKPQTMS